MQQSTQVVLDDGTTRELDSIRVIDGARTTGAVKVYSANLDDGRAVFLKGVRLRPRDLHDVNDLTRAARETALLRFWPIAECASILQLIGVGTAALPGLGGAHLPIFPFADGGSLDDRLRARTIVDPAAVQRALDDTLGEALEALHGAGLVHCDVAPNNIVSVGGRWLLADFDRATAIGGLTTGLAGGGYSEAKPGCPAAVELDEFGVEAIRARLRGGV